VTDDGWISALPALLAAAAMLLLPGLLAVVPLRLGLIARTAVAGAVSVASVGLAGVIFALIGIPFAGWQPFAVSAPLLVVCWLVARRAPLPLAPRVNPAAKTLASWALAAAVIGVVAFLAVPRPALIAQTYDNVFHLSAIASILDQGVASSATLRGLIEPERSFAFYPSAWHSLVVLVVQITGAPIGVAVNASWLAIAAVVWLPGVAWLAEAILPHAYGRAVAFVALPLGSAFGSMPYALLAWGTLYPTFVATALVPMAIAVPVLGWRAMRVSAPALGSRITGWTAAGTAVALSAIAFSQPRVIATWALLLAAPAIGIATGFLRRRRRASLRRTIGLALLGTALLVTLATAALSYLIAGVDLLARPLDDRLGGPQARAMQSIWQGVWQVVSQSWLTGVGVVPTWPAVLLSAAVICGAVVVWRTRHLRWALVSYALIAVLFVLAAGSDDILTKLATGLWYKDKYRLSSALPVLGVVLAAVGVLTIAAAIARWTRPARAGVRAGPVAVVLAWIVCAASAVTMATTGVSAAVGVVFELPEDAAGRQVISRSQIEFFGELGSIIPDGQRVLGDPWDGSAWTLVFGDVEPVFPHVNGQWDADRATVAWRLADIDDDPAVCAALDALRVRYVVYDPHEFGGGDPSGNHFPGPRQALDAGRLTLVASEGSTRLYRIDQCGELD
jgi:hypothetical protein